MEGKAKCSPIDEFSALRGGAMPAQRRLHIDDRQEILPGKSS